MAYRANTQRHPRPDKPRTSMVAKYRGTCAACGASIAVGDLMYFERVAGTSRAWHPSCAPKSDAPAQPAPTTAQPAPAKNAGAVVRASYESMGEFLAAIDANESKPRASIACSETRSSDSYFSLVDSLPAAMELARDGWRDVREESESLMDLVSSRMVDHESRRAVTVRSVAGGSVNVARALSGHPKSMARRKFQPAPAMGRVVKIIASCSYSGAIRTDQIKQRGAAICALVESLHRQGYSVEVWADVTADRDNAKYSCAVRVQHAASNLDIDSVMFALAHPALLRRLVFAECEIHDAELVRRGLRGSMGQLIPRDPIADDGSNLVSDQSQLVLPCTRSGADVWPTTREGWADKVRGWLAAIGIESADD